MKVAGKSIASIGLIALAMALAVCTFSACGQKEDPEQVVRAQIASELDPLKNLDAAAVDEMLALVSDEEKAELAQYGVDLNAYMLAFFNDFDYSVVSVSPHEDTVDVQVALVVKDLTQLESALTANLESMDVAAMSLEEIEQALWGSMVDVVASLPTRTTDPISATYSLKDKAWVNADALTDVVGEAMFG